MAWFPGAIRKPVAKHRTQMAAYNRVNLHVAVSEASSLFGYFNRADVRVCSHFYVRRDGTVEQYVDTANRAAADYQGNDATISVETQGGVSNAQGEPWTEAQAASLARIFAWAVATHGIPARLATDSRIGASSKGLSWHRLGIDPWRVDGGMRYSTSAGKVCPGNAKIAQIPTILARSVGVTVSDPTSTPGGTVTAPTGILPAPLTPDDPFTEDDMDRTIEGFYEHLMGRKAGRPEVNGWIDVAATHGIKAARDGIAGSGEAKAFAALPAAEQAARRAKAAAVAPVAPVTVAVGEVTATVDAAAITAALRDFFGSL